MMNKLIILCAPSGTGKTTVARMLAATDRRFQHVQVLTTRLIRPNEEGRMEKVHVKLEELKNMYKKGELVNFNVKDGVYYGIRRESITKHLNKGLNPILEWDINQLSYWDDKFPVFKVILKPVSKEQAIKKLNDGRDPQGIRKEGVLNEIKLIELEIVQGDITIINFDAAIMNTVQKIRKSFFASNK